jgi:LysM repeat protein
VSRRLLLFSPLVLLVFALAGCFASKSPEPAPTSAGILSGITTITSTPLPACITPSATVTATGTDTASTTATASATASATPSGTATLIGTAPAVATLVPTLCATPTVPSSATALAGASGTPGAGSATPRGSATPSGSQTPTSGGPGTYTVKDGDSIGSIAVALNTTSQALIDANNLSDPNLITVGQVLKVPAAGAAPPAAAGSATAAAAPATPRPATPAASAAATSASTGANTITAGTPATGGTGSGQNYTVQAGDTGCKIATSFKVSLDALAAANNTTATGLSSIQVGQVLKVPASTGSAPSGC